MARVAPLLVAALHLALSAALSRGWVFGKYPRLASLLSTGELTGPQVGDASPAYLLLHVVAGPGAVRWLQALVAAACVGALFAWLRPRAGLLGAWAGAGLLALAQPWLVYSAVLEPDLLIGAACLAGLLLAERGEEAPGRGGLVRVPLLGSGALLGLAAALRPSLVLLGLLVGAALLVRRVPRRSLAGFALAWAVALAAPVLALGALARHDLRVTMSAGQVFHQAHRPESVGFGAVFPALLKVVEVQAAAGPHPPDHAHELYRELARASAGEPLTASQTEGWWAARAAGFLFAEPLAASAHLARKAVFFVVPPSREYDIHAVHALLERSALAVPLRALTALGAAALTLLLLRRQRPLVGLGWLAALGVALTFYGHGRYLVGVVPVCAALVGLAAPHLAAPARGAVFAAWPAALLLLPFVRQGDRVVERVAVLGAPTGEPAATGRERYVVEQAALPDVFWPTSARGAGAQADDVETQRAAAELAERRWGTEGPVDATLAAALWAAAGDCGRALELAEPAASTGFAWALADQAIDPRLVASDCLVTLGRRAEAVRHLEAASASRPRRLAVLARLVAAGDTGEATALERWERELFETHDAASARFALAQARRLWGDPQGARAELDWLEARWAVTAPFASHERALCFLDEHDERAALSAWARATQSRASLHGERRFDALVARLPATEPEAGLALRHWRRRGRAPP